MIIRLTTGKASYKLLLSVFRCDLFDPGDECAFPETDQISRMATG